jgi:hypothetical protein
MAGRRGLTGARPSGHSRARWLAGGGATGRGVHRESTSSITEAQAAVWRLIDGGEEMVEEVLGAGGAWARREEKRRRAGRGAVENGGSLHLYRG